MDEPVIHFEVIVAFKGEEPAKRSVNAPNVLNAVVKIMKEVHEEVDPAKHSAFVLASCRQQTRGFLAEIAGGHVTVHKSDMLPLDDWQPGGGSERHTLRRLHDGLVHIGAMPNDTESLTAFTNADAATRRQLIIGCFMETFALDLQNKNREFVALSQGEIALLLEALESHEYWQLSDEHYRANARVQEPGTDDPEKLEDIKATRALVERLETLKRT